MITIDVDRLHEDSERGDGTLAVSLSEIIAANDAGRVLDRLLKQWSWSTSNSDFRNGTGKTLGYIGAVVSGGYGAGMKIGADLGSAIGKGFGSNRLRKNAKTVISGFRLEREVHNTNPHERAVLRTYSTLALAGNKGALAALQKVVPIIVWSGGDSARISGHQQMKHPPYQEACYQISDQLMEYIFGADRHHYQEWIVGLRDGIEQDLKSSSPELYRHIFESDGLPPPATAWTTSSDLSGTGSPFKHFEPGTDLFLGMLETAEGELPIGYNGNESLVTVASSGSGKTQGHIFPALLTYDGPLIVLDPKLELMKAAGKRQADGKRILVLSLTDDEVETHRINILEFIDTRPEFLWGNLIELTEFLMPPTAKDSNPIFHAKGAEMFAVCVGGVLLECAARERVPTLPMAISKLFEPISKLAAFFENVELWAQDEGCQPLAQSARSFAELAKNLDTREDFQRFQVSATRELSKLRGGLVDRVADGPSDWKPSDLRAPGCTLFIRVAYEEMHVYSGFVRLILYLIIKHLRKHTLGPGELPVTLLLDEVSQMKGCVDQLGNIIEVGRSAGLRSWMIFQDYDQVKEASSKPNVILKSPKIRLFMNPTLEAAKDLSEELGKINQVITGKDKPLAEPSALMGERYADSIIAMSSGSRPVHLKKHFAWREPDYLAKTSVPYQFERSQKQS